MISKKHPQIPIILLQQFSIALEFNLALKKKQKTPWLLMSLRCVKFSDSSSSYEDFYFIPQRLVEGWKHICVIISSQYVQVYNPQDGRSCGRNSQSPGVWVPLPHCCCWLFLFANGDSSLRVSHISAHLWAKHQVTLCSFYRVLYSKQPWKWR